MSKSVPKINNTMTDFKNSGKVCVEILSKALENPITTEKQSYYILERLASCFVEVSRDVTNLTLEVYGNGVPGGLKTQLGDLKKDVRDLKDDMSREMAEIRRMISDDRVAFNTPKEDKDTFKKVVAWGVDKLLPHMITAVISIIVAAVLWAIRSGALDVPLP